MGADDDSRTQVLWDERLIVRVLNRYCSSFDYGDREAFLDLFTEDAVWSRRYHTPEREPCEYRGREEIGGFFDREPHAPDFFQKHLCLEPQIDIDGDRAQVTSYFARLDGYPAGPLLRSFGRYHDTLVRCADRKWRFKERRAEGEAWNAIPIPADASVVPVRHAAGPAQPDTT